jgi:hypothetical protein
MDAVQGLAGGMSLDAIRRYGPLLNRASPQELIQLGQQLASIRRNAAAEIRGTLGGLKSRFADDMRNRRQSEASSAPGITASGEDAVEWARSEGLDAYAELQARAALLQPGMPRCPGTGSGQDAPGPPAGMTVPGGVASTATATEILALPQLLEERATAAANAGDAFNYMPISPVGQLHLERLEMYPVGIEHGELAHSVPLTPKETVNITHREWTVTTSTFENLIQDSFEGFSETGVTEKTDLTQASETEAKHSSALDINGSASASYNGAGFSVTASLATNYTQQMETQQTEKDSVAHSSAITRNASARTKKDHKMSFRVSSVAGAEDLSVRVITNPSDTDAMRVDYFQLLRRWQVDLTRYGLRMTYDIVIPNPGRDLVGRTLEIQAIDRTLTTSTYSFPLKVADVTPDKWIQLSQDYGVQLDPPPAPTVPVTYFHFMDPAGELPAEGMVELDIPDGYKFSSGQMTTILHVKHDHVSPQFDTFDGTHTTANFDLGVNSDLGPLTNPGVGAIQIHYDYLHTDTGSIQVTGTASLLQRTLEAWQLGAWTALQNADQAAYSKRLDLMNTRKAYLQAEMDKFDALTLRKMEREEIMRWVLRWLIGPAFDLMPSELAWLLQCYGCTDPKPDPCTGQYSDPPTEQYVYPNEKAPLTQYWWNKFLSHGELVKFLHNAIEWENVLFFSYPYFWDYVGNWPFKRFLTHPDPIHREFLRSGAMRVVLTVRPGYETIFAGFLSGDLTTPPANTPYVTIADEIRNYARTNYEGIPPANPEKNVRPQLYYVQQKAWREMQTLIQLIESYGSIRHNQTLTTPVTASGVQSAILSVTVKGIPYGATVTINPGQSDEEAVMVITTTMPDTFTADFQMPHAAGVPVVIDDSANMYPETPEFPAVIQTLAGTPNLPLTDPWGNPYLYTSPGLNADYELVCYGSDGIPDAEQTDPAMLADPLTADITSYAEGSIVGRWYEYTPTGALDVSLNTVLPTVPQPA